MKRSITVADLLGFIKHEDKNFVLKSRQHAELWRELCRYSWKPEYADLGKMPDDIDAAAVIKPPDLKKFLNKLVALP